MPTTPKKTDWTSVNQILEKAHAKQNQKTLLLGVLLACSVMPDRSIAKAIANGALLDFINDSEITEAYLAIASK